MRENRPSGSMRGEARRSLASASQSVRFAYSTHRASGFAGGLEFGRFSNVAEK